MGMINWGDHHVEDERGIEFTESTTAVLLKTDGISSHESALCHDLLGGEQPSNRKVLAIDFRRLADQWIDTWKDDVGTLPAALRLVVMDETVRSTAVTSSETDSMGGEYEISAIDNPEDLTAIGIELTDCLEQWADSDVPVLVCINSVSTMLQYMSLKTVFRFLHVFIRQLESSGAMGHFHIDPMAHDERTMARLLQLFDAIVTVDEDGNIAVQER